jgi:hypothetical protein
LSLNFSFLGFFLPVVSSLEAPEETAIYLSGEDIV